LFVIKYYRKRFKASDKALTRPLCARDIVDVGVLSMQDVIVERGGVFFNKDSGKSRISAKYVNGK
jgi:hypothetical protein